MTVHEAEVTTLLGDADPEARRRGAQLVGQVVGGPAVALLARALGDDDWRVRKEAAAAAPGVEPRASVVVGLLEAVRDRENVGLRNAAVEALTSLGRDAVAPAVDALIGADPDTRKLLVELLGGISDLHGTEALARALEDEDGNVRAAAAEALGAAGLAGEEARALAVEALTTTLAGKAAPADPLLRLAALDALGRLGAVLAWETFEPLTHDPLLRRHAIAAASRSREPAAVIALANAVAHPSSVVAREALVALVNCLVMHDDEELRDVARRALLGLAAAPVVVRGYAKRHDDVDARGAALAALGLLRISTDVPELVRGLFGDGVSEQAELGLVWFGEAAVAAMVAEGAKSAPPVRAAVLSLVPLLARRVDDATLETLRDELRDATQEVVTAAIQALAVVGEGADLARVAAYATSGDGRITATASAAVTTLAGRYPDEARALAATISPDAGSAVVGCLLRGASLRGEPLAPPALDRAGAAADLSFLRGALDHRDAQVRRAAVDALASIGGATAGLVVARALADEERDVVLAAVRALGRIGQAEPLLALLEGVSDAVVVAAALRALGEASPERAFEAARPFLGSEDPRVASSAVEAIGPLRGESRDDGLFAALRHPHSDVVKSALVLLSRDLSPRTLAHVGACLDHPSYEVRRFTAVLLVSQPDVGAHALVRARLDRETDPVVREALTLALGVAPRPLRGEP